MQQSAEEIQLLLVIEDVGRADNGTVAVIWGAVKCHCFYLIIVSHFGDELVHTAGGLISGVFRRNIGSIVQVFIYSDGFNNRLRWGFRIAFLSLWCLLNDSTASLYWEFP